MFVSNAKMKGLPLMKSAGIVDRLNCFVNSLPTKSYDCPAKKFVRESIAR